MGAIEGSGESPGGYQMSASSTSGTDTTGVVLGVRWVEMRTAWSTGSGPLCASEGVVSSSAHPAFSRLLNHRSRRGFWGRGMRQAMSSWRCRWVWSRRSWALTLRHCPPTSDDWTRLVKVLQQRLRRAGLLRWHWVVEWQRRGVPHLHLAVYAQEGWTPCVCFADN